MAPNDYERVLRSARFQELVKQRSGFAWTLSACMAGLAGALYVPQVGIINPSEFSPGNSIEVAIWVAVSGRGTLFGTLLGAANDALGLRRGREGQPGGQGG